MSIEESPRQAEAQAYLHDHRVLELFDNLTSMLIFSRPEKPKNFLIDVLENLQVRIADFLFVLDGRTYRGKDSWMD